LRGVPVWRATHRYGKLLPDTNVHNRAASALETIVDGDKPKLITQRPERQLAIAKPKPKAVEHYAYDYRDDDEDDLSRRRLVRQG
jgi:hypothetical protein